MQKNDGNGEVPSQRVGRATIDEAGPAQPMNGIISRLRQGRRRRFSSSRTQYWPFAHADLLRNRN